MGLQNSFEMVVKDATKIYIMWRIADYIRDYEFSDKRLKKVKKHSNKLCEDKDYQALRAGSERQSFLLYLLQDYHS